MGLIWRRRGANPALLCVLWIGALVGLAGRTGAQGAADNPLSHQARGPIAIRDSRPYSLLFLQFLPETADTLPRRVNTYSLQLDIINNLLRPYPAGQSTVIEDNEYQRLTFGWRRGLGHATELGLFLPLLWRNGGITDGLLRAYHRLVGLPGNAEDNPAGRDSEAQYQSVLQLIDRNGNVLVNQGNGFGLGELTLTLKRELTRTTPRAALAARFGLKLPTGNPTLLLGSGNVDAGVSLDARYSLGRDVIAYLNLGGVLMGHARHLPGAQSGMVQSLLALEYRPNNRDSYILQVDDNSLAVKTGNGFVDRVQSTATFGYKRILDRHLVLTLAFSENGDIHNYNILAFSNIGPDITFTGGLQWQP